jgi:hypothetical protein
MPFCIRAQYGQALAARLPSLLPQVHTADTGSGDTELTIVELRPGSVYRFHVAAVTLRGAVVPGTCQKSPLVFTANATYELYVLDPALGPVWGAPLSMSCPLLLRLPGSALTRNRQPAILILIDAFLRRLA